MYEYEINRFMDEGDSTWCHFTIYMETGRQRLPLLITQVAVPEGATEAAIVALVEQRVKEYAAEQAKLPRARFPNLEGRKGKVP